MTPDAINARLQRIIAARCTRKITRQECIEAMRYWRSLLPESELVSAESGSNWTQGRPYVRLAPSPIRVKKSGAVRAIAVSSEGARRA